ncbi:hypothetical protein MKW92_043844 [Papaver armeniacum]|nr:hypothetical protein MKW92_043844 [Papaver armeniacum]
MFRPAQNDYRAYFNWNTNITPLETNNAMIPRHKFNFTKLENFSAAATNTYLTSVLTNHTNLLHWHEFDLVFVGCAYLTQSHISPENSGMKLKVTLWGDSTSSLPGNLEVHELNGMTVMDVVLWCLCKASLSSTNATKIYFDLDIPEVLHIRERSSHKTPPLEITIPPRGATTAQLNWLETQETIGVLAARYLLRLEVEDSSGHAFFVAMDSEVQKIVQLPALDVVAKGESSFSNQVEGFATVQVAFESLIGVFQDYHILITPYNMKYLGIPSFTVAKLPSAPPAPTPTMSAQAIEIICPADEPVAVNEPPRKKPCLQKMPNSTFESTVAED